MPTYEYVCDACGIECEKFQPITAKPLRKCGACGKPRLRRLISAGGGVLFKGSGFYETDYRSDSYKKAAEAESKAASGDGKAASSRSKDAATDKPDKGANAEKSEKTKESKPAEKSGAAEPKPPKSKPRAG